MIDEKLARPRTQRNGTSRYNRLLNSILTEADRRFIDKRVAEERTMMEALAASTFPIKFPLPAIEEAHPAP